MNPFEPLEMDDRPGAEYLPGASGTAGLPGAAWPLLDVGTVSRLLVSVLVFVAGVVASWLLPAVLRFVFRHLLGSEVVYVAPEHRDWWMDGGRRWRYARASYWRTSFFDLLYAVTKLSCFVTGLVLALWIVHLDLWFLVAGLGFYAAIALFQIGFYLQNVFSFFCLKMDLHCHIREGDLLSIQGHVGILTHVGIQRSRLLLTRHTPQDPAPDAAVPFPASVRHRVSLAKAATAHTHPHPASPLAPTYGGRDSVFAWHPNHGPGPLGLASPSGRAHPGPRARPEGGLGSSEMAEGGGSGGSGGSGGKADADGGPEEGEEPPVLLVPTSALMHTVTRLQRAGHAGLY